MPPSLQTKFAGLPRWAWVAILGGGLVIGLVLRSRQQATQDIIDETTVADQSGLDLEGMGPGYYDESTNWEGQVPYPPGVGGGIVYVTPSSTTDVTTGTPCTEMYPSEPPANYHWECVDGIWELTYEPPVEPPDDDGDGAPTTYPCTSPPPSAAPKGYQWRCVNNNWQLTTAPNTGPVPCSQRPPFTAPKGYQWRCVNNAWKLVLIQPTPPPKGGTPCSKAPPYTAPRGYAWKCINGFWKIQPVSPAPKPCPGGVPCSQPPPYKPPTNYHWECHDNCWGIVQDKPSGGTGGTKCGPKPNRKPRKGYKWVCECTGQRNRNCKWVQKRKRW